MRYADLSFKKIIAIVFLGCIITAFVLVTTIALTRTLGESSLKSVSTAIVSATTAWRYRLEFNLEFGGPFALNAHSLLATIGLTPAGGGVALADTTSTATIPVLLYHGVVPAANGSDVTLDNFKAQMFALKAAGWQTVTMDQFIDAMQGKTTLPPKSFLLTFDDGRKDSFYPVDPILQALDYHAVMFVIAGHSLNPDDPAFGYYLTETELTMMVASGRWDIESHSDIGHAAYPVDASGDTGDFYANKLWIPDQESGEASDTYAARVYSDLDNNFLFHTPWDLSSSTSRLETDAEFANRVGSDLTNAKQLLDTKLGIDVEAFAYPFNDFAQNGHSNYAEGSAILVGDVDSTYPVSFYQWSQGTDGYSENTVGVDSQLLRRVEVDPTWSGSDVVNILSEGQAKGLPYASADSDSAGWRNMWGTLQTGSGALQLVAGASTTGAFALLDGSQTWKNYTYSANIDWQNAQDLSLMARYKKGANVPDASYVECSFESGSVSLRENDSGASTVIEAEKNTDIVPGNSRAPGLRIAGNYAQCLWNGSVVAEGFVSPAAPVAGGVAVEVWSPPMGVARASVNNVSIKAQ